jgi:hypothetical protein
LECGSFGSALRTLDHGLAAPIAQRYPPQPIPQTAGHSTIFRGFSAVFTRKFSAFSKFSSQYVIHPAARALSVCIAYVWTVMCQTTKYGNIPDRRPK